MFCICSYMNPFDRSPIRLRPGPPGPEAPRLHPRQAHPASVVAAVQNLIERTCLPHATIAYRTGVNKGTVSRWAAKYGWVRPPGATPYRPRPETRYVPVLIGRALAQRLRIQAERLIGEIERAPRVDPAALSEALNLLVQAREEQKTRRTRLRMPPPRPDAETASTRPPRNRSEAAERGWRKRYGRRAQQWALMSESVEK